MVLSETLTQGLQQYRIGEKLRALRLKKKMGLVELGRHSGLSPALLSKIERGRLVPTLPTLLRIALVFSVGLEHFFNDPAARPTLAVVRRGERQRFPERQGDRTRRTTSSRSTSRPWIG
jgi:transcriptional regulator with XRE-family HTH domain